MPNRYVREDAIESVRVNSLTWQAEVFWRRLLNRVDDFGRIEAHPALLRARCFPLQLDEVTEDTISALLAQLHQAGLAFPYNVDGKDYIALNKWEKGRAKSSKHPSPPANILEQMQTHVYTPTHPSAYAPDSDPDSGTGTATATDATPPPPRPTLEQARETAPTVGVRPDQAESWWNAREANGWYKATNGGGTIRVGANWQADLKRFVETTQQYQNEKRTRSGSPQNRNKGTLNKPSDYAD